MKKIRLDGVVGWDILAEDVARQIEGEAHIHITVNSGGGDILEGFSIYNLLSDFSGRIDVSVDFAASMASVFIMAADSIAMKDSSSLMMIHRPWGASGGNSEDLRKHADNLDKMEEMLLDIYIGKTDMNRAQLSEMLASETWMDAKEAKSFGFIDVVEGGKADLAAVAMAGMKASSKVDFDAGKLVAKIETMRSNKKPVRDLFAGCETLAGIETVMRQELKLSQNEAAAIVAAVKKLGHGDRDQKEALNTLNNFNFSFGGHQ